MRTRIILSISILAIATAAAIASTQTGGPYELSWSTIDGGGGTSSGGPYTISGTIGQPDNDWSSDALDQDPSMGPVGTVFFVDLMV